MSIKHAIVLSDLHVGSTWGVWPENFVTQEGYLVGQTPFQRWLHQGFKDLRDVVLPGWVGKDKFGVIINGDLVEGIHHKSLQVMTPDPADQTRAVTEVLGPLRERASKLWLTLGTECHTRNDEYRIGAALDAEKDPDTGHHAFPRLLLEFGRKLVSASHHMPTSTRPWLETSALKIVAEAERSEAMRAGHRPPDIVLRAHRHRHGEATDGAMYVAVTGPWQGLTRFGHRVVPGAVCMPSAICLTLEKTGDVTIRRKLWIPEQPTIVKA